MSRVRKKPIPKEVIQFGQHIKTLRTARNLSQMDVGAAIGIDRENIRKYEKGLQEPRLSIIIKFTSVFHVSFDSLFSFLEIE